MDPLMLFGLAWLLKGSGASVTPKGDGTLTVVPGGNDDLKKRANQKRAQDWIPLLITHGATPVEADGIARWIGIESGGNPLAVSPLGERGLLQIMPATAKAVFSDGQWSQLIAPTTTREQHAALAMKQYRYHVKRAMQFVANPPTEPESQLFYAKMHHTRPVDMREGKVHGPARPMARDLQLRWAKQPNHLRRLAHSSVVAFNEVTA